MIEAVPKTKQNSMNLLKEEAISELIILFCRAVSHFEIVHVRLI